MDTIILKISSLGTIYGDNGFEMIFEDFLNKMEKNIKSDEYSIIFNEGDINFDIIFDKNKYILELDSEEKKNFIEGKYRNNIFILKRLADKKLQINKSKAEKEAEKKKKEAEKEKKEEVKQKIIDDADKDILPNDEAKLIYLNELKKRRNKVFPTSLKVAFEDDLMNFDDYKICFFDVFLYSLAHLCLMALDAAIGCIGVYFIGLFFNASPLFALGGIIIGALTLPIRKLLKFYLPSLKKAFDERKLLTHKINALEDSLKYKQAKSIVTSSFDNSLTEPVKSYAYQFKDVIFGEISDLLDRVEYIDNVEDKAKLNREIKTILIEYQKGIAQIENADALESFSGQNIFNLQRIITNKLLNVEEKLTNIRAKNISAAEFQKEMDILNNRLGSGDSIEIDKAEIDGIIEAKSRREPVPVLVLKRDIKQERA